MFSIFIEIGPPDHVRCPAWRTDSDATLRAASDQRVVCTDAPAINHGDGPAHYVQT